GFLGVYWSQRFLAHPKVFTVAAIIPMTPGCIAFKAMIALVTINNQGYSPALWARLIENLLSAGFILSALAMGLAMPGLLFYRRRPVI
ncbi:threonine/serine exporter family protein, partial [Salinivibrio socompensis]|uniref:threonine/serine exporter family protein n=1 Tax=Salinivibrio socompensis TaxID=1510206 RepID=UPI000470563A